MYFTVFVLQMFLETATAIYIFIYNEMETDVPYFSLSHIVKP